MGFSTLRDVLPDTAAVGPDGALMLGGVSTCELAERFGTALLVIDGAHVRARAQAWQDALAGWPGGVARVSYACKALATVGLLETLAGDEGLGADVASLGELEIALRAGVPPEHIVAHGNDKRPEFLQRSVDAGVGLIVLDAPDELDLLHRIVAGAGRVQDVLVRVNPDIEVETHEYIRTGHAGSKFGVRPDTAVDMLARCRDGGVLHPRGIHVHLGSQLTTLEPWQLVAAWLGPFAARLSAAGTPIDVLDMGGGLGIRYEPGQDVPTIAATGAATIDLLARAWESASAGPLPTTLIVEPGRSIIGSAGVTLYEVGVVKRDGPIGYINVDGGMSDNPRPMLYHAVYTALNATRADAEPTGTWWIAGTHCESGDVLVEDAELPDTARGDIIALAGTGAYTVSMGSNYNVQPRAGVVWVEDGAARELVRRETVDDILARDVCASVEQH